MFARKTVFIIGAGCSYEYSLPVGDGLRDRIADLLDGTMRYLEDEHSGDRVFIAALHQLGIQSVFRPVKTMAQGIRHASSIDRYLHVHRADQEIIAVGKLAIARTIQLAEAGSTLKPTKRGAIDPNALRKNGSHWLGEMFLRMQADTERDHLEDVFSNVSFVCFNYDRCIEHYFYRAVLEFGAYNEDRAAEATSALKIHHPYGTIGPLPWQQQRGVKSLAYGEDAHPTRLVEASRRLATFTESVADTDDLQRMRETIQSASQIVFMGFSFLDQNMELITPEYTANCGACYATVYREAYPNQAIFKNSIAGFLKGRAPAPPHVIAPALVDATAGDFVHDYGNMLAR